jgi:hypothetical protein
MNRPLAWAAVALLLVGAATQAQGPDLGPALKPANDALGKVIPPALNTTYGALGQNITREDVRMALWINMTKGDVNPVGLLVGSGRAEVQAVLHGRMEIRVLSSDRIRAALEGQNAYNISADNATFLSQAYLPAEVFRASASAEVIAAFQRGEEDALGRYLRRTVPEMDILALDFTWSNVSPTQAVGDTSLTEPPIILDLDLVVQYLRVESLPSLIHAYADSGHNPKKEAKKDYVHRIKDENGTALRSRDFFAAAAYTQLLNLSMQPGWSLDVHMHLPRGYSFTYFNDQVTKEGDRGADLHVDASTSAAEVHKVFLASITQRKMVALALLGGLWACGLVVAFPLRFLYGRYRLPNMKAK